MMWWSQTIPLSLLAISPQHLHPDRWGHALKPCKSSPVKLKDGLVWLRRNSVKSICLVQKLTWNGWGWWNFDTRSPSLSRCMIFFPEDFFNNQMIISPCYEFCENHLSKDRLTNSHQNPPCPHKLKRWRKMFLVLTSPKGDTKCFLSPSLKGYTKCS